MKLPLAYYGDPVLRKKVSQITEITAEIRKLADDMIETMRFYNGIGLAGPQVHQSLAIFVTEIPVPPEEDKEAAQEGVNDENWTPGPVRVYINPKIISYSDEMWIRGEGCLSIPEVYGPVIRPVHIKIQAQDLDGKFFEEEFSWLDARCFMHENDHINGVLFVDRVQGKDRTALDPQLRALKKKK